MTSLSRIRCAVVALAFLIPGFPAFGSTPEPPVTPTDYVVDLAGVVRTDARTRLNASLRELEQKTSVQMLVLTIQRLDNEDIAGFSLRIAETWRLGKKGKDNGILMVVAVQDRKYRFEIGYGLEPILPDSLVGSIGREHLIPNFRRGDYSAGITNAAFAIMQVIARHEGVQLQATQGMNPREQAPGKRISPVTLFILLIVFGPIILGFFRAVSGSGRRYHRSGWWGGGYGGGGSGGFSGGFGGGGGGSFGGGGASGSW